MADDFIVEEESSNRTFLYAAGGMGAIFVIGLIIVVVMIMSGRNGDANDEIAIRNMTIEYQNKQVTLTVAQMNTVAAYTATPSPLPPTPTWTPIPSFTPTSTPPVQPTDVIQTPTPETGEGEGGEATGTDGSGVSDAVELTPTVGPSGGQLPESGMGMWGVIGAAAALTAIIVFARRFRPAA